MFALKFENMRQQAIQKNISFMKAVMVPSKKKRFGKKLKASISYIFKYNMCNSLQSGLCVYNKGLNLFDQSLELLWSQLVQYTSYLTIQLLEQINIYLQCQAYTSSLSVFWFSVFKDNGKKVRLFKILRYSFWKKAWFCS